MNLIEFIERGGAVMDQMAATQLADLRRDRDAADRSHRWRASPMRISPSTSPTLRKKCSWRSSRLLRSYLELKIHDDFARAAAASDIGQTMGMA